jgi:leader peptidase (prepilin peptidase) / N-methyltransferase
MVYAILVVLGLALGSFVNALVWRLHEQERGASRGSKVKAKKPKANAKSAQPYSLSIMHGRSMCPKCRHELAAKDLIPIFSWLTLGGKCRYCKKPISVQYPLVEAVAALLFLFSYVFWPNPVTGSEVAMFVLWLAMLVGLISLVIYDLLWMVLPDKIIFSLMGVALAQAVIRVFVADKPLIMLLGIILGALVGGGIFYFIFQISKGKWMGGGDVKLGFLLGIVVASPAASFLLLFLAALSGTIVSLPLLLSHRLTKSSRIPFGPFLIFAAVVVVLSGHSILFWYQKTFLPYTI